jgi:hypothetical protein
MSSEMAIGPEDWRLLGWLVGLRCAMALAASTHRPKLGSPSDAPLPC